MRIFQGGSHWFLAQNVYPPGSSVFYLYAMDIRQGGDIHEIQILPLEQLAMIAVNMF
jgi:hypothetical protein